MYSYYFAASYVSFTFSSPSFLSHFVSHFLSILWPFPFFHLFLYYFFLFFGLFFLSHLSYSVWHRDHRLSFLLFPISSSMMFSSNLRRERKILRSFFIHPDLSGLLCGFSPCEETSSSSRRGVLEPCLYWALGCQDLEQNTGLQCRGVVRNST